MTTPKGGKTLGRMVPRHEKKHLKNTWLITHNHVIRILLKFCLIFIFVAVFVNHLSAYLNGLDQAVFSKRKSTFGR